MELLRRYSKKKDVFLTKIREHEHVIKFIKHLKIGMRIIKTVVAVFICCLIDYFRGVVPFQSTMAAIICIQPDTENTVNMAISRVLATLLGSISATLMLFTFAHTSIAVPSVTFYVAMSLILIPLISITVKMGWPSASALTCIIFLTICLGYNGEDDLFMTALHRMIDTLVGIFVALAINSISPNRALPADGDSQEEASESNEEQSGANEAGKSDSGRPDLNSDGIDKDEGNKGMDYNLRLETPEDYREVERLTYKAFENLELPGREICDEHYLAHIMRNVPAFVPELDFVAVENGRLIGNIMYTKSKIVADDNTETETLTFGPVSVLPELQCKGIGSALILRTIEEAKKLGFRAILIFGHPEYYPRFGFVNAGKYGITTEDGGSPDAFMALELFDGALDGVTGRLVYDPVYELDKSEVEAFNEEFFRK